MADEDKKIIIDEGWKAKVQREKDEAAKKAQETIPQPSAVETAAPSAEDEDTGQFPDEIDPDVPSFDALVANLTTQAMMALGVIVPQGVSQVPIMLDQAAYVIETLAMLQEKTKGNLSAREQDHITEATAELKKIFAIREQQLHEQMLRQAGVNPTNLKGQPD